MQGRAAPQAAVSDDAKLAPDHAAVTPGASSEIAQVRQLLAAGNAEPDAYAEILRASRGAHHDVMALLHTTLGNATVTAILQAATGSGATTLGFGGFAGIGPGGVQRPPTAPPMTTEEDLQATSDRVTAEKLLTSKNLMTADDAIKGLEILLTVPDEQRTKVIDKLDATAFENLLDRIPETERARFTPLINSSKDPKRKLRLWAAFHKARAANDLHRYDKDLGTEDERTDAQERNAQAHDRRALGVNQTNAEVDGEVARLLAKDKAGTLTIEDVDRMRERKELELTIETEHNLNLNAETIDREDGTQVVWAKEELEQVQAALAQLPDAHIHDAKTFATLTRRATRHFMDTKSGQYNGDSIDIYDRANTHAQDHDGGKRELVGDELRQQHGETVGSVEYTVTHEVGHDVHADHAKAFKKFQEAAGWRTVDVAALHKAGLSQDSIDKLDARRRHADTVGGEVVANGKVYEPGGEAEYYERDKSAIPDDKGWEYGKTNPKEHFAEVYAKAVQAPESLYSDLVTKPGDAARSARAEVAKRQQAMKALEADTSPDAPARLEALQAQLVVLTRAAEAADKTARQRASEFGVMRNDVFATDKAVAKAAARLRARNVKDDAVRMFEQRATHASTPAQVAQLEREVR